MKKLIFSMSVAIIVLMVSCTADDVIEQNKTAEINSEHFSAKVSDTLRNTNTTAENPPTPPPPPTPPGIDDKDLGH